jgi:hypothetical protein
MKRTQIVSVLAQLWFATMGTGCQPDNACDTGYVLKEGQCLRAATPAIVDAGTSDSGGADTAITFGTPCKDGTNHSDCQSATTSVCLIVPGETAGQCSAVGCNTNATICPVGWSCFDLSSFQPGAPYGCVPF